MKKRNSRENVFPLWAGLLILGSLAPLIAGANERADNLSVHIDNGLISVTAQDVPIQDLIDEIAAQCDLRLVQYVTLDRVITVSLERQSLPDVLDEVLESDSYQLYQGALHEDDVGNDVPVPGTLWLFSEGSSLAPAATVFLEAVILQGSWREKKEAIRELRRLGTPDAVSALSLALSDEDPRVRDAAFEALSRIDSDEAVAAAASASVDADPWVRSEAALALSSGSSESAVQYLKLAFKDPDPRVRVTVVQALTDIPGEQAITTLRLALQDEDEAVREHAVEALEEIGGEIAFQALIQARMDENPDAADAVNESLSSLAGQHPD